MNKVAEAQVEIIKGRAKLLHDEAGPERHPRIAIMMGPGHGDHMRGVAFANAVRRHWGANAHIIGLMHFSAAGIVSADLGHAAKQTGALDEFFLTQDVERDILVGRLVPSFDVVYDAIPYAVGVFWNLNTRTDDGTNHITKDAEARQRLCRFQEFYDQHPLSTWRAKIKPYNVFEMMAASSGLDVSEADLIVPAGFCPKFTPHDVYERLCKVGGSTSWERAKVQDCQYIVVHNRAGGTALVKQAPDDVWAAMGESVLRLGYRCVQVGMATDPKLPIPKLIDRRGYRLAISASLVSGAAVTITIEGFMAYVARALGRPCLTLFGPTPINFFGLAGNMNAIRMTRPDGAKGIPCPLKSCFQGGGWSLPENWGMGCRLGPYDVERNPNGNPVFPHCMNFVDPDTAAEAVGRIVVAVEESKRESKGPKAPAAPVEETGMGASDMARAEHGVS